MIVTNTFQISNEIKESELMELAGKIASPDLPAIAVQKLGFDINEIKTFSVEHRENHQMMKFEILCRWKNKNPENNRQVSNKIWAKMKMNFFFFTNEISGLLTDHSCDH